VLTKRERESQLRPMWVTTRVRAKVCVDVGNEGGNGMRAKIDDSNCLLCVNRLKLWYWCCIHNIRTLWYCVPESGIDQIPHRGIITLVIRYSEVGISIPVSGIL
jgi:hypothetical protein